MKNVKISLNSIDKVKAFVNEVTKFDSDFDLVSGRYVIDAKSIMGIFSLDLSKPIDLNIHSDDADHIIEVLKPYIVQYLSMLARVNVYLLWLFFISQKIACKFL